MPMCSAHAPRADDVAQRHEGDRHDREGERPGRVVQGVVERDGTRVKLTLGQAGPDADEERDVGHRAEDEELPQPVCVEIT